MEDRVDTKGLSEAIRLMETGGCLGGNERRKVERKAAQTFWRAVGMQMLAGTAVEAAPRSL